MKTTKLFLCFTFACAFYSYGQHYQTISSNRIAYFDYGQNIRAIRIDSVKYDSDSILFPFAILQDIGFECYSPTEASWIGKKIIIKPNGKNIFFNKNNDSIVIQTNAKLNDKWIVFQKENVWVEVEVIRHDTLSFWD